MATQAQIDIRVGKLVGHGRSANPAVPVEINCGFTPREVNVYVPQADNTGIRTVFMDCTQIVSSASAELRQQSEDYNEASTDDMAEGMRFNSSNGGTALADNGIEIVGGGFIIGTACQLAGQGYFWKAEG